MKPTMTFDAIEAKLAGHVDRAKSIMQRVEEHKIASSYVHADTPGKSNIQLLQPRLPFAQIKGRY